MQNYSPLHLWQSFRCLGVLQLLHIMLTQNDSGSELCQQSLPKRESLLCLQGGYYIWATSCAAATKRYCQRAVQTHRQNFCRRDAWHCRSEMRTHDLKVCHTYYHDYHGFIQWRTVACHKYAFMKLDEIGPHTHAWCWSQKDCLLKALAAQLKLLTFRRGDLFEGVLSCHSVQTNCGLWPSFSLCTMRMLSEWLEPHTFIVSGLRHTLV